MALRQDLQRGDELFAEEFGAEVVVDQRGQRLHHLEVAEPRAVIALDAPQRDGDLRRKAGRSGEAFDRGAVLRQQRAAALDTLVGDHETLIALPRHLEFGLIARLLHHAWHLADVGQRRIERRLVDAGPRRFLTNPLQPCGRKPSVTLGEGRPRGRQRRQGSAGTPESASDHDASADWSLPSRDAIPCAGQSCAHYGDLVGEAIVTCGDRESPRRDARCSRRRRCRRP